MTYDPSCGPSCPDTSHGHRNMPCALCGCGRSTHHDVQLTGGGTALMCRGFHLSGGHSGRVMRCGCIAYQAREAS